jgi:hypothetical protein
MSVESRQELLDRLARDLPPAPPAPSAEVRAVAWGSVSALILGAALMIAPHGPLVSPWLSFAALAGLSLVSAWAALESARPGSEPSGLHQFWRWLLAADFVGVLLWQALASDDPGRFAPLGEWAGLHCTVTAIGLGLLPGLALAWLIRREAPTEPGKTGRLLGLAMAAAGAAALAFCCRDGRAMHVLLWHGLPLVLVAVLGWAAGRRILRW